MGRFADKWAEADRMLRAVLEPSLRPGEPLIGAVHANEAKTFSAQLYAVGVTPDRLLLQPVDRRWAPKGDVRSMARAEVTGCSVWGWGGSVGTWLSANSDQQIRIQTADGTVKLMVLGGNVIEDALAGEGQVRGLDALIEFLLSTRR